MDNIVSRTNALRPEYFVEGGLILVDKPATWTSFDVVNKFRYAIKSHLNTKKYKVGHAGTLDPLATGLLVICFGKYTKRIEQIVATKKRYHALIALGVTTPSFDAETQPDTYYPHKSVGPEEINLLKEKFTGELAQLPPMFSAVKVKGVPLYRHARKGEEVERKPRIITIDKLDINKTGPQQLSADIQCSKGTYIRSLAYDIGQFLGTGGYLASLRRTEVGRFSVEDALTIEQFVQQVNHLNTVTN